MMLVYLLSSHIYVEETSNNLTFPSGLTDGHGFSSPSHDSKSAALVAWLMFPVVSSSVFRLSYEQLVTGHSLMSY